MGADDTHPAEGRIGNGSGGAPRNGAPPGPPHRRPLPPSRTPEPTGGTTPPYLFAVSQSVKDSLWKVKSAHVPSIDTKAKSPANESPGETV
jgi:hypothetical protein